MWVTSGQILVIFSVNNKKAMTKMNGPLLVAVILVILTTAHTSPVLDLFFGNYQRGHNSNYPRQPRNRGFSRGYADYKRICKVVNPDPYASIGSNPYPAAPFCFP